MEQSTIEIAGAGSGGLAAAITLGKSGACGRRPRGPGDTLYAPDPALGGASDHLDMIVGEVKRGPVRFNPAQFGSPVLDLMSLLERVEPRPQPPPTGSTRDPIPPHEQARVPR